MRRHSLKLATGAVGTRLLLAGCDGQISGPVTFSYAYSGAVCQPIQLPAMGDQARWVPELG